MRRMTLPLGVLALMALSLAVARATDPPGAADSFVSYRAKATKGSPPFSAITGVRLADRYEDADFDLVQARDLLVPVARDGGAILDPVTHLQAYAIRPSKACSDDARPCTRTADCAAGAKCKRPPHSKRLAQPLLDPFGAWSVDTVKADLLLVPSLASETGMPPAPEPGEHLRDHYKCYRAKPAKGAAKLPRGTQASLADALEGAPRVFDVGALSHLCTPADAGGQRVLSPHALLACYRAKPAKGQPRHVKRAAIGVRNQLGALTRDTVAEGVLCVPASGAPPSPTPTALPTPTPTPHGEPTPTPTAAPPTPTPAPTPTPSGSPDLPPDPATIAPPVERGVATALSAATAFLHGGPDPIQTGVVPGALDLVRTAVIRGQVVDGAGAPLGGVRVSILGHSELGETQTRADGMFDLVVNGGGPLTLDYRKSGLLPAQRQVETPWQDYALAPTVALLPLDAQVTTIDLASPAPIQVARGSAVSDGDGARRATLLFPRGTQAELVLPDGSTQPLGALAVRATEYTVGPRGPSAMPGELPATSGYTYAVELSADEAIASGAREVRFGAPVPFYVENFVGFPVGSLVPAGFYDRVRGLWVASENGRVVAIVGVAGGLATLDVDGDGAADAGDALASLGIDDAERQALAGLYATGTQLWRVPIPHFTPWDMNWPVGPPEDAEAPDGGPEEREGAPAGGPEKRCGSVIGCETQTLGEVVAVAGTPYRLHYQSDRTRGNRAADELRIRLTGATPPPSLQRVHVEVSIAGRETKSSFDAAPDLVETVRWDRRDAYGRALQGSHPAKVRIGYEYAGQYYTVPGDFAASFNRFAVPPVTTSRTGGGAITFSRLNRGRQAVFLWREFLGRVGGFDGAALGLGGWSLDAHHVYDPAGRTLYLGDGGERAIGDPLSAPVLRTVAGNAVVGQGALDLEDAPARDILLQATPSGMAVGADGSFYFPDRHYVRRVDRTGTVTRAAGFNQACPLRPAPCDDGAPATSARLVGPTDVAVAADGGLVIADQLLVRRVGPDGRITTVAGSGQTCVSVADACGDGGPATAAALSGFPLKVATSPDGSVYVAEQLFSASFQIRSRVRRIGPDGIITTIAGSDGVCPSSSAGCGDNGPATAATLFAINGLAVARDGTLYLADGTMRRIRRVSPDGVITSVAGSGGFCFFPDLCGDGGPASQATFEAPQDVALSPDGNLYVADARRVRRVRPSGIIGTAAGTGDTCATFACGEEEPATGVALSTLASVAVAPDGRIYTGIHNGRGLVREIVPVLPGIGVNDVLLASRDGRELYVFAEDGRHLRTLDALTNAVRVAFAYDASGRLAAITDRDGRQTIVERAATGEPTAIVAPLGQRTLLASDTDGALSRIESPAGDAVEMISTPEGLLTRFVDARGGASEHAYDPLGRLVRDDDADGGFQTLARSGTSGDYGVAVTTALARITTYAVEERSDGGERRVVTAPSGVALERTSRPDGLRTARSADGTVLTSRQGPDPRFGMQAPIRRSTTLSTPGGRTRTSTVESTASLADPLNPLSLLGTTDVLRVNGRPYTRAYDVATRIATLTTPAGRRQTTVLDVAGRLTEASATGLKPVHLGYDAGGRLATIAQGERAATLAYDVEGNLSALTDPLGQTIGFAYDAAGRVTRVTRADGEEIELGYDAGGSVIALRPPGGAEHAYGYTPAGRLRSYEPPALPGVASAVALDYDLDGAPVAIDHAGAALGLEYDSAGRLRSIAWADDRVQATYDAAGRLSALTTDGGIGLVHAYDGRLLTRTTWSGAVAGEVQRTFDDDLRIASRRINGGHVQAYSYDADGLLIGAGALTLTRSAANGVVTGTSLGVVTDTRDIDGFGEPVSLAAAAGAVPLYTAHYARDGRGRITALDETVLGSGAIYTYAYDLADRLLEVRRNGLPHAAFTYDANGNRLSRTTATGTVTSTFDAQDRLVQQGASEYAYTPGGELARATTGAATTRYAYDPLGNLRSVELPGGERIDYLIDGRNRRVGKRVDGVLRQGFLYQDRLEPIAELDGSNAVVSTFVYASRAHVPDVMHRAGATYRIVSDHLGSPRLVVDAATGAVAQRMDYDELGRVVTDTNPGFQPFGFAGGLLDRDTGLVRFGARDYDPATGRWTSKDARGLAGGLNVYAYAGGDPVNFIDTSGRSPSAVVAGFALGGAAGAGAGGAVFGLGAGSALVATAGIASFTTAIGILAAAAIIDSAITTADEAGDDEGAKEGGAPDQEGEADAGDNCPTRPVPQGDTDPAPPPTFDPEHSPDFEEFLRNPKELPGRGPTPRIPYPETPENGFDDPDLINPFRL